MRTPVPNRRGERLEPIHEVKTYFLTPEELSKIGPAKPARNQDGGIIKERIKFNKGTRERWERGEKRRRGIEE